MLIAPDGKVILEEAGLISMLPMRRAKMAALPDCNRFPVHSSYRAQKRQFGL